MTIVSLSERFRIQTKLQNDYAILKLTRLTERQNLEIVLARLFKHELELSIFHK